MSAALPVEALLVFALAAGLVVAGDAAVRRSSRRVRALRAAGAPDGANVGRGTRLLERLGELGVPSDPEERAERNATLRAAGLTGPLALERATGMRLVMALGLGGPALVIAAAFSSINGVALAFLLFAAGYLLPDLALRALARRRRERIVRELPDVLDLVLVAMEGGHGFDAAAGRAAHELSRVAPVFTAELRRALAEIASGLPRERAFESLQRRCQAPEIDGVVNVLLQSARYGTDVSEALRRHGAAMRTERRQRAQEQGARTPVRITFPMILFILPALLLVVVGPGILRLLERFQ